MPQSWTLAIGPITKLPATSQFHAVLSRWLDDTNHKDPRKGWSLRGFTLSDSVLKVEVALVDDLLCRFLAAISPGTVVGFGHQKAQVLCAPELTAAQVWGELREQVGQQNSWQLVVRTPMVFRHRNSTTKASVGLVLGHYRAVWAQYSVATMPDVIRSGAALPEVAEATFTGSEVRVGGAQGWGRTTGNGFVGTIRLRCLSADPQVVHAIGSLAALAPFSGTGSATTFGCGVTDLLLPFTEQ